MPTRVRSHLRRNRSESPEPNLKEAKVVVLAPPEPEHRPSLRERWKRDFAVPKKKKQPRQKTDIERFAEDADRLADTVEKMEDDSR